MNFAELSFYKNYLGLTDDDLIRFTDLKTPELIDFRQGLSVPLRIEELTRNGYVASTNDEVGLVSHIKNRIRKPNFYTDYIGLVYNCAEALWRHPTEEGEIPRDTLAQDSAFTYRLKTRLLNTQGVILQLLCFDDKKYGSWLKQARVIDTLECRADFMTESIQNSSDIHYHDRARLFILF